MKLFQFFITVFIVTILALAHVHLEVATVKLSYKINKQQNSLELLLDHNKYLRYNTLALKSPESLQKMLADKEINLNFASPHKVFKVTAINANSRQKQRLIASQKGWESQAQAEPLPR